MGTIPSGDNKPHSPLSQPSLSFCFDPSKHCPAHCRKLPQGNVVNSQFSICPPGLPLNTKYGGSTFPAAVTVTAIVTCIVEEDDLWMFTVLIPHLSSVLFGVMEKKRGVWSMLAIHQLS